VPPAMRAIPKLRFANTPDKRQIHPSLSGNQRFLLTGVQAFVTNPFAKGEGASQMGRLGRAGPIRCTSFCPFPYAGPPLIFPVVGSSRHGTKATNLTCGRSDV